MSNDVELYKIQDMIRQIERLNNACADNMKRLNQMMLELKGLVAMVRPQVKKTGWYGDEVVSIPCSEPPKIPMPISFDILTRLNEEEV